MIDNNTAFAFGAAATGLGCFIDDLPLERFGLQDSHFRAVYHFTVGHAAHDFRFPPFAYEDEVFSIL